MFLIILVIFSILYFVEYFFRLKREYLFVRPYNIYKQLCFLKLVCFVPWLVGRFHNFELTQNREKTRNGLRYQRVISLETNRNYMSEQ
jgi:hypothetical protein